MNIFENTKTKKALSAFVGVAVGLTMMVGTTSAATLEEQIAALQAQLNALLAQVPSGSTVAAYTFTKDLKLGSTGADVKALQKVLNSNPATVVATTGAGSAGMESTYFGAKTKAAVIKFQTLNSISPAVGYVGSLTRAKLNSMSTGTGTGTTPVATGPVSVTLAASSPSDGGLLDGQATAPLADFQFTGAGTVTSVTLKRSGFSDQDALTAVYLYDGATRLTDGYTFNNAGDLVMNNLNIVVNGTKVISVKADVQSDDTLFANQSSVAVALKSFTSGGTANAVNVQGNTIWTVAGTLATVALSGVTTVASTTVDAGTANYTVWGNSIQISQRAVVFKGATFKVVGSAPANSLDNISLIIDGVKVGNSTAINAMNNVAFDVSASPVTLSTGSHTVEVRANIVNGSSRNFYFTLEKAGDIMLTDSVYGVNTSISTTSFVANNYKAGTITIGEGTLSLTKDTSFDTSNNLTSGASNVTIGKYKLQAYSEDVKVKTVQVTITDTSSVTSSGVGLQNVALFLNGAQVGSTQNVASTTAADVLTFSLGSALIVPAGTTAGFEVRADLNDAASTAFTGTIVTDVEITDAQGMSSQESTTAGSPGTTSVTVGSATATLAKSAGFPGQSVPGNTPARKVGSYVVKAGATEGVRVTNLNVAFTGSALLATTGAVESTDIANLTVSLDGGSTKLTPVNPSLTSNNFPVDFTVAAGQTKTIEVYLDVTSATNDETIQTTMQATARGASSNIAITGTGFSSAQTGQLMTVGSGSLATVTVTSNTDTAAQYLVGGTTGQKIIRYNLTSTGGPVTVQELTFDVAGSVDGALVSISVSGNQGGTTCTAPVIGTSATLTGCNIPVPQGFGGTDIIVTADLGAVGYNGIASNASAFADLVYVKYTNGSAATASSTLYVATSSTMKIVASVPSLTLTGSGVTLANGQIKVGSITVSANSGGSVNLNALPISLAFTGGVGIDGASTTNAIALKEGNTTLTTTDNLTTDITTSVAGLVTFTNNEIITAGASKTYDIYLTLEGVTPDDSVSISLSPASSLDWDDVAGNGNGLAGTLINNYPTNTVSVSN